MDRDEARRYIRSNWKRIYPADKKGKGIICPICKSGSGKNGTGITENPKKPGQLSCWGACAFKGDVIDLKMKETGMDYNAALQELAAEINIIIDPYKPERANDQTEDDIYDRQMAETKLESDAVKKAFVCWHNGQELPEKLNKWLSDNTDYDYADSIQEFYCDYGLLNKDGTISKYGRAAIEAEKPAQGVIEDTDEVNPAHSPTGAQNGVQEAIEDFTRYYSNCAEMLGEPAAVSYLQARGISVDTAIDYGLGYDPAWVSPTAIKRLRKKGNNWTPPATARIIMPVTKNHYIARAISDEVEKDYCKMNETGGGEAGIFNSRALYRDNQTVFLTEGIFDALSIIECGAAAIAINSTSNVEKLIKQLEKETTLATIILCLDNDSAGKEAAGGLKEGLDRLNISYVDADITGAYKDPNEALVKDKDSFLQAIRAAQTQTAAKPDNTAAYIDSMMSEDIERLKAAADRKTGFYDLDKKSGGLYAGLYVIAATSSLGKTTFALQIADNLAAAGHDVLFFSMEQSRLELVSKSFSRILAQKESKAVASSLALRKGLFPDKLKEAAAAYKEKVGNRMNIIEGNFNCNISFIGEYTRRFIRQNGSRPIVFIDYLQILQPADNVRKSTTKEVIDINVTELKRISRENDLTIFVISSLNRAGYLQPVDFESLKESGGIEYTADAIWGLQLQCLNEEIFSKSEKLKEKRERIREAKAANPREIELLCLKNRFGIANFTCSFSYYPAADLFEQSKDGEWETRYSKTPFDRKISARF